MADLTLAKLEKEEAIAEKDWVMEDKAAAAELQKGSEDRYKKLNKKYHYYKSKAKRLLKQLSFVPWIRDVGWALGFNWGFNNFKTLVLHLDRFDIQPKTVSSMFLEVPD